MLLPNLEQVCSSLVCASVVAGRQKCFEWRSNNGLQSVALDETIIAGLPLPDQNGNRLDALLESQMR